MTINEINASIERITSAKISGTPKQVMWAEDIRENEVKMLRKAVEEIGIENLAHAVHVYNDEEFGVGQLYHWHIRAGGREYFDTRSAELMEQSIDFLPRKERRALKRSGDERYAKFVAMRASVYAQVEEEMLRNIFFKLENGAESAKFWIEAVR